MSSNTLEPTQAFQERMFTKIRDQMGDLMTDEDLKKLVEKATLKAFFEPRISGESYNRKEQPPLFVEMVEKHLRDRVNQQLTKWVEDHPEEITKVLQETLSIGIPKLVLNYFESKTSGPLYSLMTSLQQKGVL